MNVGPRQCFAGSVALDPRARLADSPLLPGAVLSVGGPGPDYHPARGDCAARGTLHVVDGPDAGYGVALGPGRHVIGRGAEAAVCLHDRAVSREHAVIEVLPDGGAVIADHGSQHGTLVNGVAVSRPTPLDGDAAVRIGPDKLRWDQDGPRALRATQVAGRLEFDRVFAAIPAIPAAEVSLPPPEAAVRGLAAAALTFVIGLVPGLALYFGSTPHAKSSLLYCLIAVVGPIGQYAIDGRQRGTGRRALAKARTAARDQAAALAADEEQVRRQLTPAPTEVAAMATGARPDLWSRDVRSPNGLVLRVGVADQAPSFRLNGEPWEGFTVPVLHDVPVTVDLRETGVLGVLGTGEPSRALLRWLIVQLAVARSPGDLRLVLLTADRGSDHADLHWMRWLPHLDPGGTLPARCLIGNTAASRAARADELTKLINARQGERGDAAGSSAGGEVVVVLDGALALRNLPGIGDILRRGPEAGVYVLCADSRGMAECRGACEVTESGVRLLRTLDAQPVTARPDGLDAARAERAARALAPMRDRMPTAVDQAIPYPVRLLDLMGIGVPAVEDILARWRGKPEGPTTKVILGAGVSGPVTVDIADQGPHAMLAGAPGTGKSILLQTLITALLLENRPDELNLILVDFKGGGAFLPFEGCPHVTAVIRSVGDTLADTFSEADAARMLASVRAEVANREKDLKDHDGEIDHYWRARRANPDLPRMPRVVFIFDEFARLLEVSPDIAQTLVGVAAKGRSLGVHLVFATQAMQGKLTPEMKNNIDLRISLRQNESAESMEVLNAPDAVTIPGSLRGRGMILSTKGQPRTPQAFQSGYLGDPPPSGSGRPLTVRALRWADLGVAPPAPAVADRGGPTDQALVIRAIEVAGRRLGVPPPRRSLQPPLPADLPLERLADRQTSAPPATAVPFGLVDQPDLRAQPAYVLDLARTDRLMVAGGPQSGRTTFARALVASLATRFRPDQVHLYVVEHQPAGLAEYAALPHCGGVFSPAEPDRIRRLVGWLAAETERRAATRFDPGGRDNPVIVVVVDGWEQFESRADPALAEVSLGPALRKVMASGVPLGIHVVPVGGQDLLTGNLPALCDQRLLLPFPNRETRRAQLGGGITMPPAIPGRAIDATTGYHVQISRPEISAADLAASVTGAVAALDLAPGRQPRRFPALPARLNVAELRRSQRLPSPTWVPLGIGGPDMATVGIDLFDGNHLMLLSGPPGSGRTTAIATLARLLSENGTGVVALAPPQSPLPGLLAGADGVHVLTGTVIADDELRAAAGQFGAYCYAVLLDDADRLTIEAAKQGFNEPPSLLEEISRPAGLGRHALVLAGQASPILAGQRRALLKVTNEILASGMRLLLAPGKKSAREFGLALEPDQFFSRPPGRGYLASATTGPTLLQLAVHAAVVAAPGSGR